MGDEYSSSEENESEKDDDHECWMEGEFTETEEYGERTWECDECGDMFASRRIAAEMALSSEEIEKLFS